VDLVWDDEDAEDFVIQEHIKLDAGKLSARLIRQMTVTEFLETDQNPAVKAKLQFLPVARDYDLTLAVTNNSN
jgi:hypothetical protein